MTLARQIRRVRSGGSAGSLALGTSVANALGYVLTVVAARRLGPEEFGGFGALLALVIVGNVAALAAQATTARAAATRRPVGPAVRSGVMVAVALGLLLAALAPVARSALQLSSTTPAVAAAVAVAAMAVAASSLGLVQGRERFQLLAVLVTAQAALRVGGGIAGIAVSPTAAGALVGMAVGLVVAAALTWLAARPPVSPAVPGALRATLSSGVMLLGFVVVTNVDVMLARHVLPADVSGLYAAGSIFAKIAFWLPQFVPLLAFPALSDPARRRGVVTVGTLAVAGCGAILVMLSWLFSDLAVRLVAGEGYGDLAPWVPGFSALGALYALAHLLVYAHLARGDRWTVGVLWTVLAGYVVVVETTADDLRGVLVPGLVAAGVIVCWGLVRERTSR